MRALYTKICQLLLRHKDYLFMHNIGVFLNIRELQGLHQVPTEIDVNPVPIVFL